MLPEINRLRHLVWLMLLLLAGACSTGESSGPVDVRFDRDSCEQCRMVLSDPHFVAEIRYFPPGKRSKVAKFDDIGCAISWLKDKPWQSDSKTEIWVADYRTGKWIDARTATYIPVESTPMDYGLAAQSDAATDGLTFSQAIEKIATVQNRFTGQGLQLHHHPEQPAVEYRDAL